jgi:hypothetical protein
VAQRGGQQAARRVEPKVVPRAQDHGGHQQRVGDGERTHDPRASQRSHRRGRDRGEGDVPARHRRVRALEYVQDAARAMAGSAQRAGHPRRRKRGGDVGRDRHRLRRHEAVARQPERAGMLQEGPDQRADGAREVHPHIEGLGGGQEPGVRVGPVDQRRLDECAECLLRGRDGAAACDRPRGIVRPEHRDEGAQRERGGDGERIA